MIRVTIAGYINLVLQLLLLYEKERYFSSIPGFITATSTKK
jgi:hypothetical protein